MTLLSKLAAARTAATALPSLVLGSLVLASLVGCSPITQTCNAVPAHRLDRHFLSEPRECYGPVPHTALGQPKPAAHVIGPGDYLSVYVFGVFPPGETEVPILQKTQTVNQRYYPPRGEVQGPATGLPTEVFADGTIQLPILGAVDVDGLTLPEAVEKIKRLYIEGEYISRDKARVTVQLLIPRVVRINVLREDSLFPAPNYTLPQALEERHRGGAEILDLPVYENDVLHALTMSGGLPGTDGAREVWVFRQSAFKTPTAISPDFLNDMASAVDINNCNGHVQKIPLVWHPGQPLPYGPKDVILGEGDVVYVPKRNEYFYTGGLLPGGRIPMPRDHDIDVLEAVALATGSTGGPLGLDGRFLANGSPGYVVPPSRMLIVRELPDGRQLSIRVDLRRAVRDAKERIYIKENDLLVLSCTPAASITNSFLNLFNFSVLTTTEELFSGGR